MAKAKLTKNELKRQKDRLKRFTRYLPTLELKKRQLIQEIGKIQYVIDGLWGDMDQLAAEVHQWVDVFAEEVDWQQLFGIKEVVVARGNIAGIDIPIFQDVVFEDFPYDLLQTPLWVDAGIEVCKQQSRSRAELQIAEKQREILRAELRITIQRIKLFEEVKIPQARESIRTIQIFLGDQQTAEMVRGKIAKAKLAKKRQEAVPV